VVRLRAHGARVAPTAPTLISGLVCATQFPYTATVEKCEGDGKSVENGLASLLPSP
jgi:hypothetical protein